MKRSMTSEELMWISNWEDLHGYGTHWVTTHEDGTFSCKDCSATFSSQDEVQAHWDSQWVGMDLGSFFARDAEFKEDFGWSPFSEGKCPGEIEG